MQELGANYVYRHLSGLLSNKVHSGVTLVVTVGPHACGKTTFCRTLKEYLSNVCGEFVQYSEYSTMEIIKDFSDGISESYRLCPFGKGYAPVPGTLQTYTSYLDMAARDKFGYMVSLMLLQCYIAVTRSEKLCCDAWSMFLPHKETYALADRSFDWVAYTLWFLSMADDRLHSVGLTPDILTHMHDGRLFVRSIIGSLMRFDAVGRVVWHRDLGSFCACRNGVSHPLRRIIVILCAPDERFLEQRSNLPPEYTDITQYRCLAKWFEILYGLVIDTNEQLAGTDYKMRCSKCKCNDVGIAYKDAVAVLGPVKVAELETALSNGFSLYEQYD